MRYQWVSSKIDLHKLYESILTGVGAAFFFLTNTGGSEIPRVGRHVFTLTFSRLFANPRPSRVYYARS